MTDTPPAPNPSGEGVDDSSEPENKARTFWAAALGFAVLFKDLTKPRYLLLLAGILTLGLVGLTGGWSSIETGQVSIHTAEPGSAVSVKPFVITVKRAFWTEGSIHDLVVAETGFRSLLVVVEVTNTTSDALSIETLQNAFRINAEGLTQFGRATPAEKADPTLMRSSDFNGATWTQPDLPTGLVLIWQQSTSAKVPDQIVLTLREHTWRVSPLAGGMDWYDPTDLATVTVPIAEYQK